MRNLAIIPFLVAAPAFAQDIKPGDVAALPTLSPAGASHGEVATAMNGLGDVLMVWEAQVDATGQPNGDLTRIEGVFLRRRASSTWRPFATATLGEADPALLGADMVYAGGDTCSAPSVEAIGDHFIVSWTRSDASGNGDARIECASIENPGAGGGIVHSASAGVGFAVESIGGMGAAGQSDLTAAGGDSFVLSYVSNVGQTTHAGGDSYDFELRAMEGTMAAGGAGAPTFGSSALLDSTLAFDDLPGDVAHAAAVEPSGAMDEFGNYVVAYGDYRSADRLGFGFDQRGRMEVARFSMGSFAALNAQSVVVRNADNLQRSVNLATSPTNTEILMTLTAEDVVGGAQNQLGQLEIDYPNASDNATLNDQGVGLMSWSPNQGESLRHRSVRVVISDLVSGSTAAVAYKRVGRPWLAVQKLTPIAPEGLALAHLETDPTATHQGWLAVMTRGDVAGDSRCHVFIARL